MKTLLWLLLPVVMSNSTPSRQHVAITVIGRGQMPALAAAGKEIHLVYGTGDSLLYQSSTDAGNSFGKVQLIAKLPGLNASSTRGPQIVTTNTGVCVLASTSAGSIYSFTRSKSGSWGKPVRVTDRDSVAPEGFVAVASDGQTSLFASWLDVRGSGHNKIFGARSQDGGKSWIENAMVYTSPDTTVCECCKLSVAMHGSHVVVMFRNWLQGNRDLYLIESENSGKNFGTAQKLGFQSWALNGCPMDGGALSLDTNDVPATVWNRMGTIYSCTPGRRETPLGQGRGCTISMVGGRKVYAWINNEQITVLSGNGVKKILGAGRSPVLQAVSDDTVLCVWENNKQLEYAMIHA